MKRIVFRTALICFCFAILTATYTVSGDAKIDPETIMGMWLLDEGQGSIVKDKSGNGNDGKIVGIIPMLWEMKLLI